MGWKVGLDTTTLRGVHAIHYVGGLGCGCDVARLMRMIGCSAGYGDSSGCSSNSMLAVSVPVGLMAVAVSSRLPLPFSLTSIVVQSVGFPKAAKPYKA